MTYIRFVKLRKDGRPVSRHELIRLTDRPGVAIERVTSGGKELHVGVGSGIRISAGLRVEELSKIGGADVGRKGPEYNALAGVLRVRRVSGGFFGVGRVKLSAIGSVQEAIHRHRAGVRRLPEARSQEHIGRMVIRKGDGLGQVRSVERVQGVQIVQPVDESLARQRLRER